MSKLIRCRVRGAVSPYWGLALLLMSALPAGMEGQQKPSMKLELRSASYSAGGLIPKPFTCDGPNRSPAISWTDPPPGTQSFAIVEDDPDAPRGTFVHWVVYDLPAALRSLPEGAAGEDRALGGGRQGVADFGRTGYGGPCPPPGKPHRYFIRLYALNVKLALPSGASRKKLDLAMKGHILAQAELMARYGR